MAYSALPSNWDTLNDSDKNSAAIRSGYTGLNDYLDQKNRNIQGQGFIGVASPSGSSNSSNSSNFGATNNPNGSFGSFADFSKSRDALNSSLKTQGDQVVNDYKAAIAKQPTLNDLYSTYNTQLGGDAVRQNALSLQQTLANIPSVQKAATGGFDVTANQLARQIAARQTERAQSVNQAQQNSNAVDQMINTRLGLGQAQNALELKPYDMAGNFFANYANNAVSGYNTDESQYLAGTRQSSDQAFAQQQAQQQQQNNLATIAAQLVNAKDLAGYNNTLDINKLNAAAALKKTDPNNSTNWYNDVTGYNWDQYGF